MKLHLTNFLRVEHTQFPVGQGGLHLCQLNLVPASPASTLNIVYDCGSTWGKRALRGNLDCLAHRVTNAFCRPPKIDVLVLSHLHRDHINGFEILADKHRIEVERLIIPHYSDEDILFLVTQAAAAGVSASAIQEQHAVLSDPAGWFGSRGVRQIVAIRGSGDGDAIDPPPTPGDGPPTGFETIPPPDSVGGTGDTSLRLVAYAPEATREPLGRTTEGRASHISVPNRTFFQPITRPGGRAPFWTLVPFCQRSIPGSLGHQSRADFKEAVQRCLAPNLRNGRLDLSVHSSQCLQCLKKAWSDYVGKGHRTWNLLSLSCYLGFTASYRTPRIALSSDAIYLAPNRRFSSKPGFVEVHTSVPGWLMTGDATLEKTWQSFFAPYLKLRPMLQSPHHGSHRSFRSSVLKNMPSAVFATCASRDPKHPSRLLEKQLRAKGLQLHRVTEDPSTILHTCTTAVIRP